MMIYLNKKDAKDLLTMLSNLNVINSNEVAKRLHEDFSIQLSTD